MTQEQKQTWRNSLLNELTTSPDFSKCSGEHIVKIVNTILKAIKDYERIQIDTAELLQQKKTSSIK